MSRWGNGKRVFQLQPVDVASFFWGETQRNVKQLWNGELGEANFFVKLIVLVPIAVNFGLTALKMVAGKLAGVDLL